MTQLRSKWIIAWAATALLVAGLACNAVGGAEPTSTPRPTRTPAAEPTEEEPTAEEPTEEEPTEEDPTEEPTEEEPTEETQNGVLFEDDFSDPDSGWEEAEDETALREYRDDEYVMEIYDTGWFIWNNPGQFGLSDTHTIVTVRNVGESQDPTFGVICNFQDDNAFYYMGIGPDGYYAIVRVDGEDDVFLTDEDNQWILSEDIEINAEAYDVEGICAADGTLTLIVNGVEIASVQDDTYSDGDIGLFAQSFEQVPVEVHFDDFVVLPAE